MTTMEVTSYLVLVVYMVSFAGLTAASAKLSGNRPWFLVHPGETGRVLGLVYLISLVGAAVWPLLQSLSIVPAAADPLRTALDGFGEDLVGHALMGIGAAIGMVSQMHASELWRYGSDDRREQHTFIQDGPYALSRNPVFLGQILLFVGLFLVFPGIVQAVLTALLLGAIFVRVPAEERERLATVGEPYRLYCARVRRWLGSRREARADAQ